MERGGNGTVAAAVRLRALVPLTSREEEERYWYEPGERDEGGLAGGAERVYWFDRQTGGVDIAWSWVDLRTDH